MCQLLAKFTMLSLLWATALSIAACGPQQQAAAQSEDEVVADSSTETPVVGKLEVGEAVIDLKELDDLVRKFGRTFNAFGPETLSWHLLQGGMGPAALLHERLKEESATAKSAADEVAARIGSKEDFYAEYQAHGGQGDVGSMRQPTPFALGARVAAHFSEMEPGEWVGPLQTTQGWEIVFLEDRNDSLRMVAGIYSRSILFEVGTDDHRREARDAWAKLPLRAPAEFLRSLPAQFRRGRTAATPR